MKILLTGSEGFIGKSFIKYSGYKNIVGWDIKSGKDIKDITVDDLNGIDIVIHLAAFVSGDDSFKNPSKYIRNNARYTFELAAKCVKAKVKKFIFASSAAVYGEPPTPYGASKKIAEDLLSIFSDEMDIHILRFFNVYGPGQNSEYAGVITKMFEAIKNDEIFTLYNNGQSSRDFIYITDVIKAIKKSIKEKSSKIPIDVGTTESTKIKDLIDKFYPHILKKGEGLNIVREKIVKKEIQHSKAIKNNFMNWQMIDLSKGLKLIQKYYDK